MQLQLSVNDLRANILLNFLDEDVNYLWKIILQGL